jgi:hypothetical protein
VYCIRFQVEHETLRFVSKQNTIRLTDLRLQSEKFLLHNDQYFPVIRTSKLCTKYLWGCVCQHEIVTQIVSSSLGTYWFYSRHMAGAKILMPVTLLWTHKTLIPYGCLVKAWRTPKHNLGGEYIDICMYEEHWKSSRNVAISLYFVKTMIYKLNRLWSIFHLSIQLL